MGKKKNHRAIDIRTERDVEKDNRPSDDRSLDDEEEDGFERRSFSIGLYMWEFGQNDPKR